MELCSEHNSGQPWLVYPARAFSIRILQFGQKGQDHPKSQLVSIKEKAKITYKLDCNQMIKREFNGKFQKIDFHQTYSVNSKIDLLGPMTLFIRLAVGQKLKKLLLPPNERLNSDDTLLLVVETFLSQESPDIGLDQNGRMLHTEITPLGQVATNQGLKIET